MKPAGRARTDPAAVGADRPRPFRAPRPPREPLLARADAWQQRWRSRLAEPRARRRTLLLSSLALTALAALLRFWNLAHPHALVFDETYYVKDAYSLWQLGYEGRWPEGANESFLVGDLDIYSATASFVVHPPLGKWLIALGMAALGADTGLGWRFATALLGTLMVPLLMLAAWQLLRSLGMSAAAGLLLAVDGQAIVMSRVALLDGILAFFVLLGFVLLLADRSRQRSVLLQRLGRHSTGAAARHPEAAQPPRYGPVILNRPWLLLAGAALGAATAVKWSGIWYLAAFGLLAVAFEVGHRRAAGIARPRRSAWLLQSPVLFLQLVPIALATHLLSWSGWFASTAGYGRQWAASGNALPGLLGLLPESLQSWLHYQQQALGFHTGLHGDHVYEAPAWSWPLLGRPTLMHSQWTEAGEGCLWSRCGEVISGIANPLLWWAGVLACLVLLWMLLRMSLRRSLPPRLLPARPVAAIGGAFPAWPASSKLGIGHAAGSAFPAWQSAAVLTAVGAGWLPWLAYPERTVFQFYTIVFLPYLILALVLVLSRIRADAAAAPARRQSGLATIAIGLAVIVLLSAYWYPLWTAIEVPEWFYRLHLWLPGWR